VEPSSLIPLAKYGNNPQAAQHTYFEIAHHGDQHTRRPQAPLDIPYSGVDHDHVTLSARTGGARRFGLSPDSPGVGALNATSFMGSLRGWMTFAVSEIARAASLRRDGANGVGARPLPHRGLTADQHIRMTVSPHRVVEDEPASDTEPSGQFFLIVADHDRAFFFVEGPMIDLRPWDNAARHARDNLHRRNECGPAGPDRDALAGKFQRAKMFAGVPPGSIVRPRE
jgi:hypothetical protein